MFEVRFPGSWIDKSVADSFVIQRMLDLAVTYLTDASLTLRDFETASQSAMADVYERRRPFVAAESFIFSIFRVGRVLDRVARMSSSAAAAANALWQGLPDLKDVRDSVQHSDERATGHARGKRTAVGPVNDGGIETGNTDVIAMGNLVGTEYRIQSHDGRYLSVAITQGTIDVACSALQAAIEAFNWTGIPQQRPVSRDLVGWAGHRNGP